MTSSMQAEVFEDLSGIPKWIGELDPSSVQSKVGLSALFVLFESRRL